MVQFWSRKKNDWETRLLQLKSKVKINSFKIKFLFFAFVFFSLVSLTKVHKIKVVVKWLARLMIVTKQQTWPKCLGLKCLRLMFWETIWGQSLHQLTSERTSLWHWCLPASTIQHVHYNELDRSCRLVEAVQTSRQQAWPKCLGKKRPRLSLWINET